MSARIVAITRGVASTLKIAHFFCLQKTFYGLAYDVGLGFVACFLKYSLKKQKNIFFIQYLVKILVKIARYSKIEYDEIIIGILCAKDESCDK